ncbi:MAG: YciC family protein [Methylocystaceae bacterium]
MFEEVLTETFNVFLKNIKRYAILALIIALPIYALNIGLQGITRGFDNLNNAAVGFEMLHNLGNTEAMDQLAEQSQEQQKNMTDFTSTKTIAFFLGVLLLGILGLVGVIAATYVTDDIYQLREQSWKMILARAFKKLPGLVAIAFISGIAIVIGFVLLVIPGIILMVKFSLSLPIYVMEDISITSAISRSWQLTKGKGWAIFLVNLIFFILIAIVSGVIGMLLAMFGVAVPHLASVLTINCITTVIQSLLGYIVIIAVFLFYGKTVGLIAMKGKMEPEWEAPKPSF